MGRAIERRRRRGARNQESIPAQLPPPVDPLAGLARVGKQTLAMAEGVAAGKVGDLQALPAQLLGDVQNAIGNLAQMPEVQLAVGKMTAVAGILEDTKEPGTDDVHRQHREERPERGAQAAGRLLELRRDRAFGPLSARAQGAIDTVEAATSMAQDAMTGAAQAGRQGGAAAAVGVVSESLRGVMVAADRALQERSAQLAPPQQAGRPAVAPVQQPADVEADAAREQQQEQQARDQQARDQQREVEDEGGELDAEEEGDEEAGPQPRGRFGGLRSFLGGAFGFGPGGVTVGPGGISMGGVTVGMDDARVGINTPGGSLGWSAEGGLSMNGPMGSFSIGGEGVRANLNLPGMGSMSIGPDGARMNVGAANGNLSFGPQGLAMDVSTPEGSMSVGPAGIRGNVPGLGEITAPPIAMPGAGPAAGGGLGGAIGQMVGSVSSTIGGVAGAVDAAAAGPAGAIRGALGDVAARATAIGATGPGGVIGAVMDAATSVAGTMSAAAGGAAGGVRGALDGAAGGVRGAIDGVAGGAAGVAMGAAGSVGAMINGVAGSVGGAASAVAGAVGGAAGGVAGAVGGMAGAIAGAAGAVAGALGAGAGANANAPGEARPEAKAEGKPVEKPAEKKADGETAPKGEKPDATIRTQDVPRQAGPAGASANANRGGGAGAGGPGAGPGGPAAGPARGAAPSTNAGPQQPAAPIAPPQGAAPRPVQPQGAPAGAPQPGRPAPSGAGPVAAPPSRPQAPSTVTRAPAPASANAAPQQTSFTPGPVASTPAQPPAQPGADQPLTQPSFTINANHTSAATPPLPPPAQAPQAPAAPQVTAPTMPAVTPQSAPARPGTPLAPPAPPAAAPTAASAARGQVAGIQVPDVGPANAPGPIGGPSAPRSNTALPPAGPGAGAVPMPQVQLNAPPAGQVPAAPAPTGRTAAPAAPHTPAPAPNVPPVAAGGGSGVPNPAGMVPQTVSLSADQQAANSSLTAEVGTQTRVPQDAANQQRSEIAPLGPELNRQVPTIEAPARTALVSQATTQAGQVNTAGNTNAQATAQQGNQQIAQQGQGAAATRQQIAAQPPPPVIAQASPAAVAPTAAAAGSLMGQVVAQANAIPAQVGQAALAAAPAIAATTGAAQFGAMDTSRAGAIDTPRPLPPFDAGAAEAGQAAAQGSWDQSRAALAQTSNIPPPAINVPSAPAPQAAQPGAPPPREAAIAHVESAVGQAVQSQAPGQMAAASAGLSAEYQANVDQQQQAGQQAATAAVAQGQAQVQQLAAQPPPVTGAQATAEAQTHWQAGQTQAGVATAAMTAAVTAAQQVATTEGQTATQQRAQATAQAQQQYAAQAQAAQGTYQGAHTAAQQGFQQTDQAAQQALAQEQQTAQQTAQQRTTEAQAQSQQQIAAEQSQYQSQQSQAQAQHQQQVAQANTQAQSEQQRIEADQQQQVQSQNTQMQAETARLDTQGQQQVQQHLQQGEQQYTQRVAEGQSQADAERQRAESEAAAKEAEAERENSKGGIIGAALNWIRARVNDLLNAAKAILDAARNLVISIMEAARSAALALLEAARNAALAALNAAKQAIQGVIQAAANAIRSIISAAASLIRQAIQALASALQSLVRALTTLLTSLVQAFQAAVNALLDGLIRVVSLINSDLGAALDQATRGYRDAFNNACNQLQQQIQQAGQALEQGIQQAADAAIAVVDRAEQALNDAVTRIEQTLHNAVEAAYQVATAAVNAAFDAAAAAVNAVFDAAIATVNAYFDTLIAAVDLVQQGVNLVIDAYIELADRMLAAISEIAAAIVDLIPDSVLQGFVDFWNGPWRSALIIGLATIAAVAFTVATGGVGGPLAVMLVAGLVGGTIAGTTYLAGEAIARQGTIDLSQNGQGIYVPNQGYVSPADLATIRTGPDGQPTPEALATMQRLGITPEQAQQFMENAEWAGSNFRGGPDGAIQVDENGNPVAKSHSEIGNYAFQEGMRGFGEGFIASAMAAGGGAVGAMAGRSSMLANNPIAQRMVGAAVEGGFDVASSAMTETFNALADGKPLGEALGAGGRALADPGTWGAALMNVGVSGARARGLDDVMDSRLTNRVVREAADITIDTAAETIGEGGANFVVTFAQTGDLNQALAAGGQSFDPTKILFSAGMNVAGNRVNGAAESYAASHGNGTPAPTGSGDPTPNGAPTQSSDRPSQLPSTTSSDPAPVGTQPAGTQPVGTPPVAPQSSDRPTQLPSTTSSDPTPVSTQPVGTQPVGTQPVGTQPVGTQPVGTQPVGTQPVGTQPVGTQPVGTQPVGTQPVGTQPVGTQPVGTQPTTVPVDTTPRRPDVTPTGNTPPITASPVPGSDFHANGRPAPDAAAVISQAQTHAAGIAGLYGDNVTVTPTANGGLRIQMTVDGKPVQITVSSATTQNGAVAQSTVSPDSDAHTVRISDTASDANVQRALAHEVAEIMATRSGAGTTDALTAGGPLPPDAALSAHDAGRVAEARVLADQIASGDPAARQEMMALIDHLGLRQGMPDADARMDLVRATLGTDAAAAVDAMRRRPADLDPADAAAFDAFNGRRDQPPQVISADNFPTPELVLSFNDPQRQAQFGEFAQRYPEVVNRQLQAMNDRLRTATTAEERVAIMRDTYQAMADWRAGLNPNDPKLRNPIPEGDPNIDPFGDMPGLREGATYDPETGRYTGGEDTPAARTRREIGDLINDRFADTDADTIQNMITLPDGTEVPGNILHRGDSADSIYETKRPEGETTNPDGTRDRRSYGYDADGNRVFTETGSPEARRQLHDAGIQQIADIAGRDLSTPEARAQAQRDFANAAYMLFQGPVVNRGSDSTIRAFLTTTYTQAFGVPPRLPHDIDVQAYARSQQDFQNWLSSHPGLNPPRADGGTGTPPTPITPNTDPNAPRTDGDSTPDTDRDPNTGASSAIPNSTYSGDAAGRRNAHNVEAGVAQALPSLADHFGTGGRGRVRTTEGGIEIEVGGQTRQVRVEVVSNDTLGSPTDVANFDLDSNPAVIRVSDHARKRDVERALAHEVAEMMSVMDAQQTGRTDGTRDALAEGSDAQSLSHHDVGRVAEMRVLMADLAGGNNGRTRAETRQELASLLDHLGATGTDPASVRRREMIEAELGRPIPNDLIAAGDRTSRDARNDALDQRVGEGGDSSHVEVHSHFMGVADVDVFAQQAGGQVELLNQINSMFRPRDPNVDGDRGGPLAGARHGTDGDGNITRRGASGDAQRIVADAIQQIDALRNRLSDPDLDAATRTQIEADIQRIATETNQRVLRASDETDFNSSYEIRDELVKSRAGEPPRRRPDETDEGFAARQAEYDARVNQAYYDVAVESVRVLLADNVGYSEQSMSLKKLAQRYPEGVLERAIADLAATGDIDIRWLAMTNTANFGTRDVPLEQDLPPNFDRMSQQEREQWLRDFHANGEGGRQTAWVRDYTTLFGADAARQRFGDAAVAAAHGGNQPTGNGTVARPDVMGMDVAGAENFRFDAAGRERFADAYEALAAQARAQGRPMVFRPHVGEGAVDPRTGRPWNRDTDRVRTDESDPQSELLYQERARENIEQMLQMLEGLRDRGLLDPNSVIVRFGHATHVTPDQAARMRELGVIAEANLNSNVETGSLDQTGNVDGNTSPTPNYDQHGLATQIFYDVDTILSTDAHSVMSTTMAREYATARQILEDVLAGRRPVRVRPAEADGRGTPVGDGTVELYVNDLTPDELARFQNGYQRLHDAAQGYRDRIGGGGRGSDDGGGTDPTPPSGPDLPPNGPAPTGSDPTPNTPPLGAGDRTPPPATDGSMLPAFGRPRSERRTRPQPVTGPDGRAYEVQGMSPDGRLLVQPVNSSMLQVPLENLRGKPVVYEGMQYHVAAVQGAPSRADSGGLQVDLQSPQSADVIHVTDPSRLQFTFPNAPPMVLGPSAHGVVRLTPAVEVPVTDLPLAPGQTFEARLVGRELNGVYTVEMRDGQLVATGHDRDGNPETIPVQPGDISPRVVDVPSADFATPGQRDAFDVAEDRARRTADTSADTGMPIRDPLLGTLENGPQGPRPIVADGPGSIAAQADFIRDRLAPPEGGAPDGAGRTLTVFNIVFNDGGGARSMLDTMIEFRRANPAAEIKLVVANLRELGATDGAGEARIRAELEANGIEFVPYAGGFRPDQPTGSVRRVIHAKGVMIDEDVRFSTAGVIDPDAKNKLDVAVDLPPAAAQTFRTYFEEAVIGDATPERRMQLAQELAAQGVVINDPVAKLPYIARAHDALIGGASSELYINCSELRDPAVTQRIIERAEGGVQAFVQVRDLDPQSQALLDAAIARGLPITLSRAEGMSPRPHYNIIIADGVQAYVGTAYLWPNQQGNMQHARSFENGVLLSGDAATHLRSQVDLAESRARETPPADATPADATPASPATRPATSGSDTGAVDGPQTPGSDTGASSAVPNSTYSGDSAGRNNAHNVTAGVTEALPGLADHFGPGRVRQIDASTIELEVGGTYRQVRIEVVPPDQLATQTDVANFDLSTTPAVIRVSGHTNKRHVERALAHEVAEMLSTLDEANGGPRRSPRDALDADSPANHLSHHDVGRVAEVRVLLADLADPAKPRAQTQAELRALLQHLGVLNGDGTKLRNDGPGGQRRALVEAELGRSLDTIDLDGLVQPPPPRTDNAGLPLRGDQPDPDNVPRENVTYDDVDAIIPPELVAALERFGLTRETIVNYVVNNHNDRSRQRYVPDLVGLARQYAGRGLTDADVWAIDLYTTKLFYEQMNRRLRTGNDADSCEDIQRLLAQALAKLPAHGGGDVFRTLEIPEAALDAFLAQHPIGQLKSWDAFSSVAGDISGTFWARPEANVLFVIRNTDAYDISDFADGINYKPVPMGGPELLVPGGIKVRVVDVVPEDRGDGKRRFRIVLEQVRTPPGGGGTGTGGGTP